MTAVSGGPTDLARLLFPELAAELDQAHASAEAARAARQRTGAPPGTAPAAPAERAADRVAAAAALVRDGEVGRAAFADMPQSEADRFEAGFQRARDVAAWGGHTPPAPEEFWAAGVDPARLARALMADPTLQPVIVPYGLGLGWWTALYRTAARQSASPLSLVAPLVLAPEVTAEFSALDTPPAAVATAAGQAAPAGTQRVSGAPAGDASHATGSVRWTLRLVPAAETPALVGLSHAHGPHATLPEMLMLQLTRIAAGEQPVDQHSFTWLHGAIAGGRFAARALYDVTERSVRVNTREVGNQGPHLGARPPIG